MDKAKPKYYFSPKVSLVEPTKGGKINVARRDHVVHKTLDKDASEIKLDWLSHSDMSWSSVEDRYVPCEVRSDEMLTWSSVSSESSEDDAPLMEEEEKRIRIIESDWGGYGLDVQLWDEERAPYVNIRNFNEISFGDLECCGVLSDRMIGAGSSFLTKCPECRRFVLSKFTMRDAGITNIAMLYFHQHLQYIDLAYNHITNLSALRGLSYLMYLDVSHNRVKQVPGFAGPWYLTYFNLSYNHVSRMADFCELWSIVRLDLSHNAIEQISGLQDLKFVKPQHTTTESNWLRHIYIVPSHDWTPFRFLQYLNLSYNLIEYIENLDNLNILELNLEGNYITSFKSEQANSSIKTLPHLRVILLGHNRLSSLDMFKDAYGIRLIDLKFNKISDLLEVAKLRGSVYEIDLRGNSCTKWPNYRDVLLYSMPTLDFIDGVEASITEKVSAMTLFASPLDLIAARSTTKLTLLEQLHLPKLEEFVVPYDEIGPPLLVLTGPSAVKKIALGLHVADTISKRVKYCPWYTTKKIEDEQERLTYVSVGREEFNDMARSGDFLAVQELLGNSYGFHQNQIASLITEKKVGVTQMDLHSALQIRRRYSNVRTILVITKSQEIHRSWVREKFDVYTWIKDSVDNLLAVKVGKHTEDRVSESTGSKLSFIEGIIDEFDQILPVGKIVDELELPPYCDSVRPQGTGATATDLIRESKTMLPKAVLFRSQLEPEEKHIFFDRAESAGVYSPQQLISEQRQKMKGLKVILDEESNIIIDDRETKRRMQRAKILFRRSTIEGKGGSLLNSGDFDDSDSSDETLFTESPTFLEFIEKKKPEYLKEMYTELVIKSRKIYLDYHKYRPGFFSLVILTDDYTKAFNNLVDFIYELYTRHDPRKPILIPEIQHLEQVAIPETAETILAEMEEYLSSSVLQRKTHLRMHGISSWKDLMPSQMAQTIGQ